MNSRFVINPGISIPVYKQVISQIEQKIISGEYAPGFQLPSMNEMATDLDISKETIKKAYSMLRDKGVIEPRQGKGFYVCGPDANRHLKILLLFDKLSSYKQVLFNSFVNKIGDDAEITIRIHNQNLDVFEFFIDEDVDNFDYYVVTPHFPMDSLSRKRMLKLLKRFPNRKLILLDNNVAELSGNYGSVYQDFTNDIYDGLQVVLNKLRTFEKVNVVTLPNSLYGKSIRAGIERFSMENNLPVEFHTGIKEDMIRKNEVYILLNSQLDTGLIMLARHTAEKGMKIGEDISVISYNESPLNEIILNGLTTLSTDFEQMGELAADMIISKSLRKVKCDFHLIRRSTF